jgi:hypothetical protein
MILLRLLCMLAISLLKLDQGLETVSLTWLYMLAFFLPSFPFAL